MISFTSFHVNSTLIFACLWTDWGNNLKNSYIINDIDAWSEFCIWFILKKHMLGLYEGGVHNLGGGVHNLGGILFFSLGRTQHTYIVIVVWLILEDKWQDFINLALVLKYPCSPGENFLVQFSYFSKNKGVCDVSDQESGCFGFINNASCPTHMFPLDCWDNLEGMKTDLSQSLWWPCEAIHWYFIKTWKHIT